MDENSSGNSPDAAKTGGADALLSLVSNGSKHNAVDAGLVTKSSDKAAATVTKNGGQGAAALAAKKGAGGKGKASVKPAGAKSAGEKARAGAKGAARKGVGAAAPDGGMNPMKKRVMAAGAAGLASGTEASTYVDSDDIGAQAAEDLRSNAVTGAKGALRARKLAQRKIKVGHAAQAGEKSARKAKGASSLVSHGKKGQLKKMAARSSAKKATQMQAALQAQQARLAAKAASSAGAKALIYKIVAAFVSVMAAVAPVIMMIIAIIAIIALIIVFLTSIISTVISWWNSWWNNNVSYGSLTTNERQVAQFFSEKGLNAMQIAGIMGNISAESGQTFDPRIWQEGPEYGYGNFTDDYPSHLINDNNFGYGICQWSSSGRAQGLVDYAAAQGKHSGDMTVQLEWLWIELNTSYQASVLDPILAATSVEEVTIIWGQNFEVFAGCYDIQGDEMQHRISLSQEYYRKITSGGGGGDLVSWARSKVGLPYHFGAQESYIPDESSDCAGEEYDCSGLVSQALFECGYGDYFNHSEFGHGPNTYGILAYAEEHWDQVSESDARDGDIVLFFSSGGNCYHAAISTDGGFIEAAGIGVHDAVVREGGRWTPDGGWLQYYRPSK